MTTQRWTVGRCTITSILEEQIEHIPPELFFPDATAADVAAPVARAGLRRRGRPHRAARAGAGDQDAGAPSAGRSVRRQRQDARPAVLEPAPVALPRALRRGGLRARAHRHRGAHAPARRPRRLGHEPVRRSLGVDVHPRTPPLHPARAHVVRGRRQSGHQPRARAVDRADPAKRASPTSSPRTPTSATVCASSRRPVTRRATSRCGSSRTARARWCRATSCATGAVRRAHVAQPATRTASRRAPRGTRC